jgi:hypothetical protein
MKSRRSRHARQAAVRSLGAERAKMLNGSPMRNERAHLLDRRYSSLNTYAADDEAEYLDGGEPHGEGGYEGGVNSAHNRRSGAGLSQYATFAPSPTMIAEMGASYELVEALDPVLCSTSGTYLVHIPCTHAL